mgnify:CR=1 FL=1
MRRFITTSSIAALPARSPMPQMQPSTCRAPAATPAREFATARPRSSWQCIETTALSMFGTRVITFVTIAAISAGVAYPTVSGRFTVVAPAAITASTTRHM